LEERLTEWGLVVPPGFVEGFDAVMEPAQRFQVLTSRLATTVGVSVVERVGVVEVD
jgi:hypothetical protein